MLLIFLVFILFISSEIIQKQSILDFQLNEQLQKKFREKKVEVYRIKQKKCKRQLLLFVHYLKFI